MTDLRQQMEERLQRMREMEHGQSPGSLPIGRPQDDVPSVDSEVGANRTAMDNSSAPPLPGDEMPVQPTQPEADAGTPNPFADAAERALRRAGSPPAMPGQSPKLSRRDELQDLMDQYGQAQKLSANRHQQHGVESLFLSDASLRQPYVNSFREWNDAPVKDIEGRMAVAKQSNDLETQSSKIDTEREYDDPNSQVSLSAAAIARNQLGMSELELPDGKLSARQIEKVMPGIKLAYTQQNLNDRNTENNDTKSVIERKKRELKALEDEEKSRQFGVSQADKLKMAGDRNATSRANTQDVVAAGLTGKLVTEGFKEDPSGRGGAGGRGAGMATIGNPFGGYWVTNTPNPKAYGALFNENMYGGKIKQAMEDILAMSSGSVDTPFEEAWPRIRASLEEAIGAKNKLQGEGVMNFADYPRAVAQLGNMTDWNQVRSYLQANPHIVTQAKQNIASVKKSIENVAHNAVYNPSDTPSQSSPGGGTGGVQPNARKLEVDPQALEHQVGKVTGTPNIIRQPAPMTPKPPTGPVAPTGKIRVKNKSTGQTGMMDAAKFNPEFFERVQ